MAWRQLAEIYSEARTERELYLSQPPSACPNDGEPLKEGPDGRLFCPFDGWRPEMDHTWH